MHIYYRTKTHVKVTGNRLDLFVYEKTKKKIALIGARTA